MSNHRRTWGVHPLWWAAGMFAAAIAFMVVTTGFFTGAFTPTVPITVTSDRSGLVMETGAKVKMRGVEVGTVSGVTGGGSITRLKVDIFPAQIPYIPANVEARIEATTAFGSKFVNLQYPQDPSPQRLSAGAVLRSTNVSTEVNTVFQNLVALLDKIDVAKLNAVLSALAEGVRDQGPRMGEAITDANQVLLAVNPRMDTIDANWQSFKGFSDAYSAAAKDIMSTLDGASTTSATVIDHARDLDALLLNTAGFAHSGIDLLGPNKDNIVNAVNGLEPTTALLLKYNPSLTCTLVGAHSFLVNDGYKTVAGNGRTQMADAAILFGDDPYKYPENLPIVAAKGGPGGKPGCGSLPDVSKNFPVRYLVTNTGWGTGLDLRPNPGLGRPGLETFFPVTRAIPGPPTIRADGPPAIGPVPYPGAPPYGAPLYGPDGTPLYPGLPPATPSPSSSAPPAQAGPGDAPAPDPSPGPPSRDSAPSPP